MNITQGSQGLVFDGVLDESSNLGELITQFNAMKEKIPNGPYEMDFSKVTRGTSAGILVWLKFIKEIKSPIVYVNVPIWLVGQFSMIKGYFEFGSYAREIYVPFFDLKSEQTVNVLMKVGSDIPILESYQDFKVDDREISGAECEPDFVPAQYFSFIAENYSAFKKAIG